MGGRNQALNFLQPKHQVVDDTVISAVFSHELNARAQLTIFNFDVFVVGPPKVTLLS